MKQNDPMKPSLSAFMEGLIDYAGLFPPARLDMKPAMDNYLSYLNTADSAMLSAFIIPAGRLEELNGFATAFDKQGPVPFSVLAGGGSNAQECTDAVNKALEQVSVFLKTHSGNVRVQVLEIKLPDADFSAEEIAALASEIRKLVSARIPNPVDLFYEPVRNENWNSRVDTLVGSLATQKNGLNEKNGFKLRCGGVEAHMFPSVEQVAHALHTCVSRKVSFKGTAGLHHPVRHYDEGVKSMMHGFFNVFGSAILGSTHSWSEEEFAAMLREENPDFFAFDDYSMSWNGIEADITEIKAVRNTLATSYGSCSFLEPLEDLEQLGHR